ncbi:MAG: hypothetical protein HYS12_01620 [Planctomycetes bacterium]|nr:hypothetical protein [Planctomycetota bacterium]
MSDPRAKLAMLILSIVVLSLLLPCIPTTIFLFVFGDWKNHAWGIELTLKVMWSVWLAVLASWGLTYVTMFGWHFRRPHPSEWPKALVRAWNEGVQPPAMFKSASASFTITVVLVSLFGAAFLASLCLWIIGDWSEGWGPLWLALKFIWGVWWVLAIATVLVRVAIFGAHRRRAREQRRNEGGAAGSGEQPPPEPGGSGPGGTPSPGTT